MDEHQSFRQTKFSFFQTGKTATPAPTPTHKYVDEKQKQDSGKKESKDRKIEERKTLQISEGDKNCCTCGAECGPWYLCYNCTANIVLR